jgi:hypothetical protein
MSKLRIAVALVTSVLGVAVGIRPLSAQAPARSGFFIGFGLGGGSFGVEDAPNRESSASGYFKIGGALSDKVLLGAESVAWVKEEGGATVTSSSLSAVAYVYPSPGSGFFLQGGLGVARLDVETGFANGGTSGTSISLGLGYDIGFGGRFGLTPFAGLVASKFDGGNTSLAHFGLGFNWY